MDKFDSYLSKLPNDKRDYKNHMLKLSTLPVVEGGIELYPLLQANSFGGKQIWNNGECWLNACFRDYWEPTATSVRRSPANPMQPGPTELRRRIDALVTGMKGVNAINMDITTILSEPVPSDSVVYIDPPYKSTTKYAFNFDLASFISQFSKTNQAPLFVSEGIPLNDNSLMLTFGGAKGGISGTKKVKHQEWLSRF
ncbi:hypothetical protein [Vibrio cholerae]